MNSFSTFYSCLMSFLIFLSSHLLFTYICLLSLSFIYIDGSCFLFLLRYLSILFSFNLHSSPIFSFPHIYSISCSFRFSSVFFFFKFSILFLIPTQILHLFIIYFLLCLLFFRSIFDFLFRLVFLATLLFSAVLWYSL